MPRKQSRARAAALESVDAPKQARSEETLERILVAAEQLIGAKGFADASIPEIARRAGSSVGGFYARFRDKDARVRALEERFFRDELARVEALMQRARGRDLASIVRLAVAELVGEMRERRNLIAAFVHRATRDPSSLAGVLRFRASVALRMAALVLPLRDQFSHPNPELAIDLGVQFAFALTLQLALIGELRAGGRALSDRALADEIGRNFLAYLGANPYRVPQGAKS